MGVGQTLNRGQFARLGTFSMVRVLHPDLSRPQAPVTPETDTEKVARMVSAFGYLGGDVANRFEVTRASMDDGLMRIAAGMTGEEALTMLEQAWKNIDRVYAELGTHVAELRGICEQQLK